MDKVSIHNLVVRSLPLGEKFSKTVNIQKAHDMGMNPFRHIRVSLSSKSWYTSDLKWKSMFEYLFSIEIDIEVILNYPTQNNTIVAIYYDSPVSIPPVDWRSENLHYGRYILKSSFSNR